MPEDFFDTGSHVFQAGIKLAMQPRIILNVRPHCFYILSSGVTSTVYVLLSMKPRASCMLGRHSPN